MGGRLSSTIPAPSADRLQLALDVLPIIRELTRYPENVFRKQDRRYDSFTGVNTAIVIIENSLQPFKADNQPEVFAELLYRVLRLLEDMVDRTTVQAQKTQGTPFPLLAAVNELVRITHNWEIRIHNLEIIPFTHNYAAWEQLHGMLEQLVDELQTCGDDIHFAYAGKEVREFAERILSTFTVHECATESLSDIRLQMGVYKEDEDDQTVRSLCVLLSGDSQGWHEVTVHDIYQVSTFPPSARRVRWADTTHHQPRWFKTDPQTYSCICEALKCHRHPHFHKLNVVLYPDGNVDSHIPDPRSLHPTDLLHEFTLKGLLEQPNKDWTELTKFTLALILAYSLFNLYGSSWIKEHWNRSNIILFGDGTRIPLRLFLSARNGAANKLRDDDSMHMYPQLLELAVMLLEIQLGHSLDSLADEISTYNDLWCVASKVFHERRLRITSKVYRDAIEKCLKPDFSLDGICDDDELREEFFTNIVKPLEDEMESNFNEFISLASLDKEAESKIDLAPKGYPFLPTLHVPNRPLGSHLTSPSASIANLTLDFPAPSDTVIFDESFPESTPANLELEVRSLRHMEPSPASLREVDSNRPGYNSHSAQQMAAPSLDARDRSRTIDSARGQGGTGPVRPKRRRDFKIAIICALPLESDAVEAVFDRRWDNDGDPYGKAPGDRNAYSTGVIGNHNVVLVHMPNIGRGSAATVAASCRSSFTRISLALVVGICGAAPSTADDEEIVLGDIVISDGIIQHDLGRQYADQFVRKDTLLDNHGRPNMEIRALLAKLRGVYGRSELQKKVSQYLISLQAKIDQAATYPGASYDRLFESNYRHKHQGRPSCSVCRSCRSKHHPVCQEAIDSTCDELGCHESKLVVRRRLHPSNSESKAQRPQIHFGLVASGDQVIKSAEHRDELTRKEGVIAFEMEGAGVWEQFPCLIIKGVCDYADSHKNKKWQPYAAAAAAACMKAFLDHWVASG